MATEEMDYEAEYHKLRETCEILKAKLEFVNSEYKSMETEFVRMRAQLDIVYLIFGNK